jgi:GNAT superfamily N-acetyltransferase
MGMSEAKPMRLRKRDLADAAMMCARACRNTPHVRFFFPAEDHRQTSAAELFRMRIRYGMRYGEVYMTSPRLEGIAVWIPASHAAMTLWRDLCAGGTRLYRAVGRDCVARMTHVAQHNDRLRRNTMGNRDHWFLSILAVDPDHQHSGHATHLLTPMLSRLDRDVVPAYLELTDPRLIAFYQPLGFEVGSESTVPGTDLTVWAMTRTPNRHTCR